MRKCRKKILCSQCPSRGSCPSSVRADKRARRSKEDSASTPTIRRAARSLAAAWLNSYDLGVAMFGEPKPGYSGRMAVEVRARRAIKRLQSLGLVAMRPGENGVAEYTLLPEGLEVFG